MRAHRVDSLRPPHFPVGEIGDFDEVRDPDLVGRETDSEWFQLGLDAEPLSVEKSLRQAVKLVRV